MVQQKKTGSSFYQTAYNTKAKFNQPSSPYENEILSNGNKSLLLSNKLIRESHLRRSGNDQLNGSLKEDLSQFINRRLVQGSNNPYTVLPRTVTAPKAFSREAGSNGDQSSMVNF